MIQQEEGDGNSSMRKRNLMWRWENPTELYHYGIKGMKWGVRRTKEQLGHDRYSIEARATRKFRKSFYTSNSVLVKELSLHALDRTQEPTRQVTLEGILDALQKPLNADKIEVRYNEKGQPSQRFVGQYATVNVNPENGCITTVWKTGSATIRKYTKR